MARGIEGSRAGLGNGKAVLKHTKACDNASFDDEIEDEFGFDQLTGPIHPRREFAASHYAVSLHQNILDFEAFRADLSANLRIESCCAGFATLWS